MNCMKPVFHLVILTLLLGSTFARASLHTEEIDYQVDGQDFTAYLAYDDSIKGKRPGILIVHEWWGHNAYVRKRAEMLAELGYTALALDMYGSGKLARHPDDAKKFMLAVTGDLPGALKRMQAGKALLEKQASVDGEQIAAIGYCFGGGMVLQLARSGSDIDGVVSFHGSLGTQMPARPGTVKAKILVFTGEDDPFAPPEQVAAFREEMGNAGAAYEIISYPGVKHSFTNPQADKFGKAFDMPLAYDQAADEDSWKRMQVFFDQIFNKQ